MKDGKTVCRIQGNYMGFIDFDGQRYWDARDVHHWCTPLNDWEIDCLPSDSSRRRDVNTLKIKSADEVQVEKEKIEEQLNYDEALRLKAESKRQN